MTDSLTDDLTPEQQKALVLAEKFTNLDDEYFSLEDTEDIAAVGIFHAKIIQMVNSAGLSEEVVACVFDALDDWMDLDAAIAYLKSFAGV
jgi:hypothetical protein